MLCPSAREEVVVNVGPLGVVGNTTSELVVYPVPSTDVLYVECIRANERLRLIDQLGRVLLDRTALQTGRAEIDLSAFAPGNYTLMLHGAERNASRKILILERSK